MSDAPDPSATAIEAGARALCKLDGYDPDQLVDDGHYTRPGEHAAWLDYKDGARVVLRAASVTPAVDPAIRAARAEAFSEAAKIARKSAELAAEQIAVNNEYLARVRKQNSEANAFCRHHIAAAEGIETAILARAQAERASTANQNGGEAHSNMSAGKSTLRDHEHDIAQPGASPEAPGSPVALSYTNWRGETADRTITPTGRVIWTSNEWHPEPQWLVEAYDQRSGEVRLFALKGFLQAPASPSDQAEVDAREAVAYEVEWQDDGYRRRVQLGNVVEPWLEVESPTITPLFRAAAALRTASQSNADRMKALHVEHDKLRATLVERLRKVTAEREDARTALVEANATGEQMRAHAFKEVAEIVEGQIVKPAGFASNALRKAAAELRARSVLASTAAPNETEAGRHG